MYNMKAAIYCRVSTDDQGREGTSLQTQMEACLDYCQINGYQVSHSFSEAYSGLTLDRPELNKLRDLVRTGGIDVIVIYSLDRISRDPYDGVEIFKELEEHGVALKAVSEAIEDTDTGRLYSFIRGWASKQEAKQIKERTMRGKMAYLKAGKLPQGTGIGIYGYKWDKSTGRRVINEFEAQVVKKIFNMAVKGISTNQIAMSLNKSGIKTKSGKLWYPLTIRRILLNQTYTGNTYFGQTKRVGKNKVQVQPKESWILLPDVTPPIITEEGFNQAQEAMKKLKESRPLKPKGSYLLTGFIRCNKCGSTIGGTTMGGKYRYYKCRGANTTATRDKVCDAGYIRADHIENFVWERIRKIMRDPEVVLRAIDDIVNKGTEKQLEKSETKKAHMPDREMTDKERVKWEFDNAPTCSEIMAGIKAERKELMERVVGNQRQEGLVRHIESQIEQLKKSVHNCSVKIEERKELLGREDIENDCVLDGINGLKKKKEGYENQLKQSQVLLEKILQAKQLKIKFIDCCRAIRDSFTSEISLEKKREVLSLFKIRVVAQPGHYFFTTSFDAEVDSAHRKLVQSSLNGKNLVTIEQTSG